ncbi:MAG: hypothetical protein CMJ75_08910 [Planctomycetaceae bacterium]|nr:hypothetical protein [Planctomycetaceae bacterium]
MVVTPRVTGQRSPPEVPPGADQTPTPIGEITSDSAPRHTVTRFLAAGGLGKVYLAQDDELQREVVLKTLKDAGGESSEARYRFVQEAQVASEQADKAKEARAQAETAERVAVAQTERAQKAQVAEAKQRIIAEAKQTQAERNAYKSDMLLASIDWETINLGRLRETLDRYRERPGLKGFAWGHWNRLATLLELDGHFQPVLSVCFTARTGQSWPRGALTEL